MQWFARALAASGIALIALPAMSALTSAAAERWHLAQSDQPTAAAPAGNNGQETPAITEDGTPATVIDDREVEGILGKSVRSNAGEDMGQVIDVIVKRDGQVRAAVIDFGGFLGVGSRKIAVDWSALSFPASSVIDHVVLNLTPDQVRLAPEYRPGEPLVVLGAAEPVQPKPDHSTKSENSRPEK
jgi:PRC-barrel domain protein